MALKMLTARRLTDGCPVWLCADGQWTANINTALVARHSEAINALEAAGAQASRSNLVCKVNIVDVEEHGETFIELGFCGREHFAGSTIRHLS